MCIANLIRLFILMLGINAVSMAQDCNDNALRDTPDSQFKIDNNEVQDLKTGLIWQRCSVGQEWDGITCSGSATQLTWQRALEQANDAWRLPNVKELASLLETSCEYPAINLMVFPNTPSASYWTSSPMMNSSGEYAWSVLFDWGDIDLGGKIHWLQPVRLVRD